MEYEERCGGGEKDMVGMGVLDEEGGCEEMWRGERKRWEEGVDLGK